MAQLIRLFSKNQASNFFFNKRYSPQTNMKIKSILASALVVVAVAAQSFAQTADEVVAKHLEAMGGTDKLKALKSISMEAKIQTAQAPGMEVIMKMSAVNGKGFRQDITVMGMAIEAGYDGTMAWQNSPTMMGGSGNPEPLPAEQLERVKDQADLSGNLMDYKSKGHSIELLGKEDLEGTEVYKLKLNKKSGDVEYNYIDAATYLVIKSESIIKMQGQEAKSSQMMSNYKAVDGLMFPFTIEQDNPMMGGNSSVTFTSIVVNAPVDENKFKMPAKK